MNPMQTNTDFYLNQLKRLVGGKITALARTGPPQGDFDQEFFGIVITLQNGKELTMTFLADDEGNGPGSFEILGKE